MVADEEDLSRFLTQSSHFASGMAKPAALLPSPKHKNTSVFRIGSDPERLRQTWAETMTGDRQLKAVALFKAGDVRAAQLEVIAQEPPAAHANIEGWPWLENDPDLQRAQQRQRAQDIASQTTVILF
jgi:hypothetical protein